MKPVKPAGMELKASSKDTFIGHTLPVSATTVECIQFLKSDHDGFKSCPEHALVSILQRYDTNRTLRATAITDFALHHAGHVQPEKGTLWAKLDGYLRGAFQRATEPSRFGKHPKTDAQGKKINPVTGFPYDDQ